MGNAAGSPPLPVTGLLKLILKRNYEKTYKTIGFNYMALSYKAFNYD